MDEDDGQLLVTSDGKLSAMQMMLEDFRERQNLQRVIYIGDSGTDVECLLSRGGIIMLGEDGSSKLLDTLRSVSNDPEYGFLKDIRHVEEYDERRGIAIYFARDFRDIVESPLFRT